MPSRRVLLAAAALGTLLPLSGWTQQRLVRIGILAGVPREKSLATPLLLERLAELGYRTGATMSLEYRHATAPDRYRALVRDLADARIDLIFSVGSERAALALRDARTSVPVVLIAVDYDPIEAGIVQSLARPGGNITGVYIPTQALLGKRLEIAQEIQPGASRYLVLGDRFSQSQAELLRAIAESRGVRLTVVEFAQGAPYDLESAFDKARAAGVSGVFVLLSGGLLAHRKDISALLIRHRLPGFAPDIMADDPGILATYSIDSRKFVRRAAELGDRILRGAKAAEMPLEQLDEYTVILNAGTARALGIAFPPSVLARATRIIE